ncbi:cytochrome oxidase Cu insertion factor (SCO1/SenC/PrrC family) [Trinickia symbiotica]|uniref:Thioredoxin n=1 Tax=Trinickia symbiotica TaxID=863227 RepID=A0A2N7X8T9_9BURK|nr:thioredoxin family protein [Trinickia symbiotica]PMS38148.1 thioredoxin [Trinickia symbiotica]PPK47169.1 cytochrome oxidase Cu insertion factor (SCO1/SenC/PrrC family) [Trinickia symbiotica]
MLARFKALAAAAVAVAIAAAVATAGGTATAGQAGNGKTAPEFTGIDNWINSPPLTQQQLRGKVVLVDFWTYSCINCIHTLPYVKTWYQKYKDQGLVVVGVHTPEYPFERSTDNVKTAIKRFGIEYPVAQDNEYATWNAYSNQYWPAFYLIDKEGRVVYTHYGEGEYAQTEQQIRNLLAQK